MKVLHIITDLDTGGAEMMLYKLVSEMCRDRVDSEVISLTDIGPMGEKIQDLDIPVRALGMKRGVPDPQVLFRLTRWLKKARPDLIQTWMYHADLAGGLAAKLAGSIPVVWNIRQTDMSPVHTKKKTIWTAKACARLSRWLPAKIVYCSEASRRVHAGLGYDADKMVVIPNGFDLDVFRPDPESRRLVRQELGIVEDTVLIGMVGRFDPQKDHHNFIKAAAFLHLKKEDVRFLLCGDGITWENRQLSSWIKSYNLSQYFHLLGRRDDIPRIMNALDIASSSSYGEGFPNVIGEAMACGVPCVVTDVGDSALIVGKTGWVVPPRNPQALADAWSELIRMGRDRCRELGREARLRIKKNFNLPSVVTQYEEVYKCVA